MKKLIELINDLSSFFQERPQKQPVDRGIEVYVYTSFDKNFLYFLHNKEFYMFTNSVELDKQEAAVQVVTRTNYYYPCRTIQNLNRNSKEVYYVKP